jgi:hypothetical protein
MRFEGSMPKFKTQLCVSNKTKKTLGPNDLWLNSGGGEQTREVSPVYTSSGTSAVLLHKLELVGWSFTLILVAGSKGPPELVSRVHKGGSETKTQ